MKLSEFSVHRPVFISMATCIVLILGGIALRYLPVDLMPDITYPTVTIATSYEDAAPEEMEELITRPIEEAVSAVTGVEELKSSSSEGSSSVRVSFSWGTDLDAAVADIRDRLDRVIKRLPDDAERPTIRKFDVSNFPILFMGVGTDIDLLEARRIVEEQVQYRVERIDGVASAMIYGGREREIHVLFDVDKVKTLDLSLEEVLSKITSGNITTPAGNVREGRLDVRVRTPGTFSSLDEIRDTVIGNRGGAMVRIRDVAEVIDTHKKLTRYIRVNGKPGMYFAIYKQSGANTVSVANAVLKEIEKVNQDIPQIKITQILNTAEYIESSIKSVADAAIYGGLLAIFVLLFFLRNIRSTVIISVSIPVSIIATFALIYFCGFTLNIMTLGGLALGIGMLVDNAIVVLENITRLRDHGMNREDAATKGADEVTSAIIASTLTTMAVFMPLIFVKGMAGIMFKQFSTVVAFSLGCSLLAAISLVPMMASKMLRRSAIGSSGEKTLFSRFFQWSDRGFKALENIYGDLLDISLRWRWLVLFSGFGLLGASCLLIPLIGTELMPHADEGVVRMYIEGAVGTRSEEVDRVVQSVDKVLKAEVPEMRAWISRAGSSHWRATGGHKANYNIKLTKRDKRKRSSEDIALALKKKLSAIPGMTVRTRAGQGLFFIRMGSDSGEKITIDIRGHDFATADSLANQVKNAAESVKGVTDVKLSRDLGVPEKRLIIDRQKAADMKVSIKTIADAMRTILAGSTAGAFRESGEEYTILVKVKDADLMEMDDILDLTVRNASGERVVLRNLVRYEPRKGPVNIERKDQERIISVSVNIAERDMGSVVSDIRDKILEIPVPGSFNILFVGDFEEQQKAFKDLLMAFALALVLVYMVMACQFESFRDPLIVMFSVPLAAIGVLVMLFLSDTTLNIQSFIGCIMLAGIVVNNAILLVDTTNLLRRRDGMSLNEGVREAGRRRLRPILMTTLTTVLGLLPLALGFGEGGENQAPLARAVIGGLLSSTLITLLFIPAVYSIAESFLHGRKDKS